jgi:hypothetical protein
MNNVDLIKKEGVRVIVGRVPAFVRKELSQGVKNGELTHFKKEGQLHEMYCARGRESEALEMRKQEAIKWAKFREEVLPKILVVEKHS